MNEVCEGIVLSQKGSRLERRETRRTGTKQSRERVWLLTTSFSVGEVLLTCFFV